MSDPPPTNVPPDRLTRFDGRGAVYAAHRPGYPDGAIDALVEGLPDGATAADVGAGTGISSRLLAARGLVVIAIEPNADMRDAAEPDDRITWRDGTGEATGLADASLDLVLCAQSFHWMDPQPALAEFARTLRPAGRVAIMWNVVDQRTPVGVAYCDMIQRNATAPITSPTHTGAHEHTMEQLWSAPDLANERHLEFTYTTRHDFEGLVGRAASSSYCPQNGYRYEAMTGDIARLIDRYGEGAAPAREITLPYQTHVFLAERAP